MVSLEYIAGFFDGEGYISIQKASHKSRSGSRYWLTASFCNTHRSVLEDIQKITGGNVIFHAGANRKLPHYRLTLYSRQAFDFIKAIRPYLIVKREEADLAIAYQESLRPWGSRTPLTQDELCYQEQCYNNIRDKHGNRGAIKLR